MATLYVSEYGFAGRQNGDNVQIAVTPPLISYTIPVGGVSIPSSPFTAKTYVIRVHTDAICSVAVGGTSPVATTSDARMCANQTEYFFVNPGEKIAVIANN